MFFVRGQGSLHVSDRGAIGHFAAEEIEIVQVNAGGDELFNLGKRRLAWNIDARDGPRVSVAQQNGCENVNQDSTCNDSASYQPDIS